MCGIAGLWFPDVDLDLEDVASRMSDAIAARGPDGSGMWSDPAAGLVFAHRRLAIQDLSPLGHQPMASASGRFVICFNGEVYNFPALRRELEAAGDRFRGGSDTEVMLAAIERWGLERAVTRFVGMFAFALWDRERRELRLVRDRLGIKPLLVAQVDGGVAFSSDSASFRALPGFDAEIDRDTLLSYFRYACVPATQCIYRGVEKVAPGSIVTLVKGRSTSTTVFWSAHEVARQGLRDPLRASPDEAIDRVEAVLSEAVRDRQIADVPLGVFLSGGIDSSTVAALANEAVPGTKTYSIGFREAAYDEAPHAEAVAKHLGTNHTTLYVTAREAMDAVPRLAATYSEPFADSSQLPTLLVCELARREVTVVLSGDGGDEVFGGYNRHLWGPRVWGLARATPAAARTWLGERLRSRSPTEWDAVFSRGSRVLPALRTPGDKMHKLAGVLPTRSVDDLYERLTSIWASPSDVVLGGNERRRAALALEAGVTEQFMLRDLVGYMHDDILVKVDRASMSVGLEVRVPLIDHRLVELAWRLPTPIRVGRRGKEALRAVLRRRVPDALVNRPKMGFGVPIDTWLRGPLREWAEALLDPKRVARDGYLNPHVVTETWRAHLDGRSAVQHRLWTILMFQAWRERWGGR